MAVYKVAQDVEADDKLIGPFSFRQFVYLIIVALAGALAWGLSRIFIGLAVIPLPVILFFGALALPLRKDQPMEVYLAAILSFYLKPRRRLWSPDGIESLIEITAPKVIEVQRTKDLSQSEAERRLSYLANIVDTEGWAVRHSAAPTESSMNSDVFFTAQQTEDVLDNNGGVAQSFNTMIAQADERRRQEMIQRMQTPQPQQTATPPSPQPSITPQPELVMPQQMPIVTATPPLGLPAAQAPIPVAPDQFVQPTPLLQPQPTYPTVQPLPVAAPFYNPYPTIHQTVIQPLGATPQTTPTPVTSAPVPPQQAPPVPQAAAPITPVITGPPTVNPPESTSETVVSPDIIKLASNPDLSIETIQREADRIKKKEEAADDEIYVSLH